MAAVAEPAAARPDHMSQVGARLRRARRRRARQRLVLSVLGPVCALLLWEVAGIAQLIDTRFLPKPTTVMSDLWVGATRGELVPELGLHTWRTSLRLVTGLLIGSGIGLLVGLLMGIFQPVRSALGAIIYATYPMPKIAILPLLIVLLGIGEASKVGLVALGAFYLVCINTIGGIAYAPSIYRDIPKAFKLPRRIEYTKIVLPAALPSIFTGLKLAMGNALILVVSAEFIAADDGLGYYIWTAWQVLDVGQMFGGLVVVAVLGAVMLLGGEALEKRLMPWTH